MTKRCLPFLACLAAAGPPSAALAQAVGSEFQVNTHTTGFQGSPSIAADAGGNFVVVWAGEGQDDSYGIFGQRYDSSGNQLGDEFPVNTSTANPQGRPSIAADASGNFVVVWRSFFGGNNIGVFGQRYDSGGNRLGSEFQVDTYATGSADRPSVASDASGNFVVVWDGPIDGSNVGISGQRYDSGGSRLGGEFKVNTYTTHVQEYASVAADAGGNFVVVWDGRGQDDSYGIFGQRYDSGGNRLGGEFQVNTYTTSFQGVASVASDAGGSFVVFWYGAGQGDSYGIFGQRYDSGGVAQGDEFRVNSFTTDRQDRPSVASDASGDFVVVWRSVGQDGSFDGVFGQRYDSSGNRIGTEFQVNTYTTDFQSLPSVASGVSGNFVVVWASTYQDGSNAGVFGRRFAKPLVNFPLKGTKKSVDSKLNPYTAPIVSVFDHSMKDKTGNYLIYGCDRTITAFSTELGTYATPQPCKTHPGSDPAPTAFGITGHYKGVGNNGQKILNYDGHPGFDYAASCTPDPQTGNCTPQSGPNAGTNVYAVAKGKISYPGAMVGTCNGNCAQYHVLELIPDADPSLRIYYLHLATYKNTAPITLTDPSPAPGCPASVTIPTDLPDGSTVGAGCLIAQSGNTTPVKPGKKNTLGPHLHLEVQKAMPLGQLPPSLKCTDDVTMACVPVDPYGWNGPPPDQPDPYLLGVDNVPLWNFQPYLSATALSFGSLPVGNTSAEIQTTLTNVAPTTLNISSFAVSGDFALETNTCGTNLTPGDSCTFGVTFTPTVVGLRTGVVSIDGADLGSPPTVRLVVSLAGDGT